jgi:hypothetical protein
MDNHGSDLISLLKPNTQWLDAYRLKAHLFLHWFLNKIFWNWKRFSKYSKFSDNHKLDCFEISSINSSMDCYKVFKRKSKRESLWMDLRNPWTSIKWLSIAVFCRFLCPRIVNQWQDLQIWNLAGSFLHSFQVLGILFS